MSSEEPSAGSRRIRISTRRMAQAANTDGQSRVAEAIAPPPSAAPPPTMSSEEPSAGSRRIRISTRRMAQASPPSAAPPPPKPSEVRVRSPSHRAAQGSDTDAQSSVAEALVPPPSVAEALAPPPSVAEALAPPPSALRPSSQVAAPQFKVRFVLRRDKASLVSDPDAHTRVAETPAPPPSASRTALDPPQPPATLKLSQARRNPRRGARDLESSAGPGAESTMWNEVTGDKSAKGIVARDKDKSGKESQAKLVSNQKLTKSKAEENKNDQWNEVTGDKSAKGIVARDKDISVKASQPNFVSNQILTKPEVEEKKNDQLPPYLHHFVSNHCKTWSDKVVEAINNFRASMKDYSADKLLHDKVDTEASNLVATVKEIQNEQSRLLVAELAKEFDGSSAGPKQLALIYDKGMLLHRPPSSQFDEKPSRVTHIMNHLKEQKLIDRCDLFNCDEASVEQVSAVHTPSHIEDIMSISSKNQGERNLMALRHCSDGDIYYSKNSGKAALLAAGGAIKACSLVAEHRYKYSFAIVRPPGHHAGTEGPTGFCLLNNIAIGASHLLDHHKMKRILIIDFDIHHGNGTQEIFYKDDRVLFFSVHRYDTYPGKLAGSMSRMGEGRGAGYNVNVCWNHPEIRDIDYFAVWEHVLIPLAQEFQPEIILISAGFDAAEGDRLGECSVTPCGYASLLSMLVRFGPIVMVLEGGYNHESTSKSIAACLKVLLGDHSGITHDTQSLPYHSTWTAISTVREELKKRWQSFESEIPKEVTLRCVPHVKADVSKR